MPAQTAAANLALSAPLTGRDLHTIERTLNLQHWKWDTRLSGRSMLARQALIVPQSVWQWLARCAEQLAAETVAQETEVSRRPELFRQLGIPGPLRRCLASLDRPAASGPVRVMRFDFHPTASGWAVSEVNSDVPGGYGEATFLPALYQPFLDGLRRPPAPLKLWGDAVQSALRGDTVAFLSAPGYLEDAIQTPSALDWTAREPRLRFAPRTPVDGIVRFYQAEWLCHLPRRTNWRRLLSYSGTIVNPAAAVFSESKRLPLLWPQLSAAANLWRTVLPECRDPQSIGSADRAEWVLKAAFSNTGDSVMIGNVMTARQWDDAIRAARREPCRWVAQRRFETAPLDSVDGLVYPCIGIFVINGNPAGAYVRLSQKQVTDGQHFPIRK
jgi:glutathionylspermidine synthase